MATDAEAQDACAQAPEVPLAPSDLLGHSFLAVKAGIHPKGQAAILDAFYLDDRVRRMFVQLGFQFRQVDASDEARQRVALMFFEVYVPKILSNDTTPQGVYSLVYALAMNVYRSIRKEINADEVRHESYDAVDEASDDVRPAQLDPSLAEDFLPALHSKIDMERAQTEIARRLALASAVPLSDRRSDERVLAGIAIGDPVKVVPPARRRRNALTSAFARELNDIKIALGITNADFAKDLGIGLPTLASYLYARVQTVPDRVMETAREMLQSANPKTIETRRWLDTATMPDIVNAWCAKLSISKFDDAKKDHRLSEILGCNVITVWRWRTDGAKPKVSVLMVYDSSINEYAGSRKGRVPALK